MNRRDFKVISFVRVAIWVGLLFCAALLFGCRKPLATSILEWRVHSMRIPREHPVELQYLVQFPRGYHEDTNRVWPTVFYLHGIGEWGSDMNKVVRFGPPRLMVEGRDLPFIVVSPQLPQGYFAFRESNHMLRLMDEVTARYRVDRRRVHVTGNSMGAYGAVLLAAREPERFASVVPVCGGVDYVDALRLRDVPMWAFHGEDDPIIPVAESRRMVELVRGIGGKARLTVYPGVGHNSWDRAYNEPELWQWMLAQRK